MSDKGSKLKVFLSYSNLDKELAGHIKNALEEYGIEAFLAHEDIQPSAEWIETIRAELKTCHIFLPILTGNFHNSCWTDQETGLALGRNIPIIPVKTTTDPYGFMSRIQALGIDVNTIQSSCCKLAKIISSKPKVGDLFRDTLISKFGNSGSYEEAAHNTDLLLSFEDYTLTQVIAVLRHTVVNSQINHCYKARRKLRDFIYNYRDGIDADLVQEFDKTTAGRAI